MQKLNCLAHIFFKTHENFIINLPFPYAVKLSKCLSLKDSISLFMRFYDNCIKLFVIIIKRSNLLHYTFSFKILYDTKRHIL